MAERSLQTKPSVAGAIPAVLAAWHLCLNTAGIQAAEEPPAVKPPRIAVLLPLGVPVGQKTRVTLRGWALKDTQAIASEPPDVQITVASHAAAPVPAKQKAEQVGDELLELDVQVPDGLTVDSLQLIVRTPAGQSAPGKLLLGSHTPLIQEMEPNDGFRQAQQIAVPQTIEGSLHADANVDVFAFELSQPTRVSIHVQAAALGSALDSVLTLMTSEGAILDSRDDSDADGADSNLRHENTNALRDPVIVADLPPGKFLIALQDAHDRGGPAHPYRLTIQPTASK